MSNVDLVIIGGGIIGGSILYNLYEKGFQGKTIVFEKNNQLAQGSTSLSAGGIRNLWSTEVNLQLTNYSINELKDFKNKFGVNPAFEQIGYLFTFYEKDWEAASNFIPIWEKNNVNVKKIPANEIKKLVPNFKYGIEHISEEENEFLNMEEIVGGILGTDCGIFNPTTVAMGYYDNAIERYGKDIEIRLNTEVEKIIIDNNKIKGIKLNNNDTINTNMILLTAGAWSADIIQKSTNNKESQLPILPWKRQLFTVKMPKIEKFESIPMTIIDNGIYFRPEAGNLLVGRADPEEKFGFDINPDVKYYDEFINYYMSARIPGMEYSRIVSKASIWGGLYAHNTQDKNAIIGFHPNIENLFMATGFSGHGVMEAPAIGLSVAEKIIDNEYKTIPEVKQLYYERFANGELIKEKIVI